MDASLVPPGVLYLYLRNDPILVVNESLHIHTLDPPAVSIYCHNNVWIWDTKDNQALKVQHERLDYLVYHESFHISTVNIR